MPANEPLNDLDFTRLRTQTAPAAVPAPTASPSARARPAAPAGAVQVLRRRAKGLGSDANAPVLVVEDDEDMRRLIHRVLDKMGLVVRIAGESHSFQAALRRAPLPRLILLDVELPGISGFKMLTALRRHPKTKDIPVLMVTARAEDRDLIAGLTMGADGYLSKPFHIDALRAMVASLLESPA